MTELQARQLSDLAADLCPKSKNNANQRAALVIALYPYPFEVAQQAIIAHACECPEGEEFISLPGILGRIRRATEPPRVVAEPLEAERLRELRARDAQPCADSVRDADAFCAAHAERLDGWRRQLIEGSARLERLYATKTPAQSLTLRCLIFQTFGAGKAVR